MYITQKSSNMGVIKMEIKRKTILDDEEFLRQISQEVYLNDESYFEATVLSHELDHLDVILHMDIAEEVLNMTPEERKAYREEHPYEVISKICEKIKTL